MDKYPSVLGVNDMRFTCITLQDTEARAKTSPSNTVQCVLWLRKQEYKLDNGLQDREFCTTIKYNPVLLGEFLPSCGTGADMVEGSKEIL